jgi:uncharacterized membrane protein YeaQ/YmgE (transglycosylase-associated protein family)
MLHLIGQVIFGFIVGVLAKFVLPGKDPGGVIVTGVIGIVGSLLGTFLGRMLWGGADYRAGWIVSVLGAVTVLLIYHALVRRQKAGA